MLYDLALDPLTWDSVVAAGLFGLTVLWALARFSYRHTDTDRTYAAYFRQHPYFAPLGRPNGQERKETLCTDGLAEVHTQIVCKKAVSLRSCSFRLVDRRFRPHLFGLRRWAPVPPRIAFVTNVWDAEWERGRKHPLRTSYRPSPVANLNDTGGYTVSYSEPLSLLATESLWFRVIVDVQRNSQGYLEFEGPAPDGRPARTHMRVVLRRQESEPEAR